MGRSSDENAETKDMKEELNSITNKIINGAVTVHRELGPGLLESAYETCLVYEMMRNGLNVQRQKELPITYKGVKINAGYRIDLLIDNKVIVELKAVENLAPIHEAQLLSYLKLSGCMVGLLINFNVKLLSKGIRRIVHRFPD